MPAHLSVRRAALSSAAVALFAAPAFAQPCCYSKAKAPSSCDEAPATFELTELIAREGRANTFTSSLQGRSCVAADPDGGLLVVWDSRRQEAGTYGVVGQRFDPLGRRIGTEFRLNEVTIAGQHEPAAAFSNDGVAWVAWESMGQDGQALGVVMRRFREVDGEFLPLSGDFIVNETADGNQLDPSVTVNDRGEALITWSSRAIDGRITAMARLFDSNGTPLTGEMTLGVTDATDRLTTAAALGDRFVTVWARTDADGAPAGLFGRFIEPDGALADAEFTIADRSTGHDHIEPSIAADADGRFIVAWMQSRADGAGFDVVAQRFGADGAMIGETLVVDDSVDGWKSGAAVAAREDGRFVVSYNIFGEKQTDFDGSETPVQPAAVFARVYGADGSAIGERFRVNQYDDDRQSLAVASNSTRAVWTGLDQLAFTWDGKIDGDRSGIGLTVLAPRDLDLPAPTPVEAVASSAELTFDDVAPPDFNPDWVPEEPVLGIQGVGPDFGFLAYQTTEWQPPDPDIAVGPDHVVAVVNMRIKVFTKDGTEVFHEYLEDFFRKVGANNFVFDPVAAYDRFNDRYVIATAEHNGSLDILNVAVSKTNNPLDGWHKYGFNVDFIGSFVDFENLGIGPDAYYITADYFGGGGNNIHIFEKAPMLNGQPVTLKRVNTSAGFYSLGAVTSYDANQPAQYFATSIPSSTSIRLHAIEDPNGTPTLSTANVPVSFFTNPPGATQRGSSNQLSTVDRRIKHGVYRNGSLWLAHAIGESNTARVRWYEIDMNGWPDSGQQPALVQEGTFNLGSGQHSWFPDIGVSDEGDVVITCSRSSSNDYPFISRFVRKAGDAPGTFREEVRLQESEGPHTGSRWGDYSGIDEDPTAPGVYWNHHLYNTTGFNWRTWVGRVDAKQSLTLEVTPLFRGQNATATITGATPNGTVYLGYSFTGTGSQYIPALDVNAGLANGQLLTTITADAFGQISYSFTVPNNAPTGPIWLQALEFRNSTNVLAEAIN
ncbi:MAG: hypothetical protein ACF8PN_09935 [Phycisphaerales bacterium]